jgi:hypothetical protein
MHALTSFICAITFATIAACSSDGEADGGSNEGAPVTEGGAPQGDGDGQGTSQPQKNEEVPGGAICEEGLPIFANGVKYSVKSSKELADKTTELDKKGGEGDNVWLIDTANCRTYFKTNKYLLRLESIYDDKGAFPKKPEAATIVGRQEGDKGAWTFDQAKKARTLVIIGTDGRSQFRMGGFPYGVALGALVVGSTQTYLGAIGNTMLPKSRQTDAARAKSIWDRCRPGVKWTSDITVVAHSAGSVPGEDLGMTHGGNLYLYGTPRFTEEKRELEGDAKTAGNRYTIQIFNHKEDPVSGSYRCAAAYDSCKNTLRRSDAKDPDAASVTCAIGKDPYCTKIVKELGFDSWAPHDYSDMSIVDPG